MVKFLTPQQAPYDIVNAKLIRFLIICYDPTGNCGCSFNQWNVEWDFVCKHYDTVYISPLLHFIFL